MNPLRALTIGLFLLLLAACEERDDYGFYSPHEPKELAPGIYDGIALYNNGADTLAIALVYKERYDVELYCPGEMYSAVPDMHVSYDKYSYEGYLSGSARYMLLQYMFYYDSGTMTGDMELWYDYPSPHIEIDTTVTLTLRGDG